MFKLIRSILDSTIPNWITDPKGVGIMSDLAPEHSQKAVRTL